MAKPSMVSVNLIKTNFHMLVAVYALLFAVPSARGIEFLFIEHATRTSSWKRLIVSFSALSAVWSLPFWLSVSPELHSLQYALISVEVGAIAALYTGCVFACVKVAVCLFNGARLVFSVFLIGVAVEYYFCWVLQFGPICSPRVCWAGSVLGCSCVLLPGNLWVGLLVLLQFAIGKKLSTKRTTASVRKWLLLMPILCAFLPASTVGLTPQQPPLRVQVAQANNIRIPVERGDLGLLPVTYSWPAARSAPAMVVFGEGSHSPIESRELAKLRAPRGPVLAVCGAVGVEREYQIAGLPVKKKVFYMQASLLSENAEPFVLTRKRWLVPFFESAFISDQSGEPAYIACTDGATEKIRFDLGSINEVQLTVEAAVCYDLCAANNQLNWGCGIRAYPDVCLGMVGNAWLTDDSFVDMLFRQNIRLRAVERRQWVVVAANMHSSMLVAPDGTVLSAQNLGQQR